MSTAYLWLQEIRLKRMVATDDALELLGSSLVHFRTFLFISGPAAPFHPPRLLQQSICARLGRCLATSEFPEVSSCAAPSVSAPPVDQPSVASQQPGEENHQVCNADMERNKSEPLSKIENIQTKLLRILLRLGQPPDNLLVEKVLYRMQLATLIRDGNADPKLLKTVRERARANSTTQETTGVPPLNFSIRILVLGRSGVGKSTTINSIFDQIRTVTCAFQPVTDCITEVRGVVHGLDITFIDTTGFLPASTSNSRKNIEIMLSIRRHGETQLLLLCVSMKVLNDASNLLGFKEGISLGTRGNPRQASLPHLLSNFLRHRSAPGSVGDDEYLADLLLSEANDQDEYDQLPPIRILTKSQFEKLTRSQKREYLDELDYREMLYVKKQLREELQRQKNDKLRREERLNL
ncbi:hypothetical protein MLD38_014430 [Melastoma candidum]|uniref:Uncharacterized protein n=1 Tax=Melastoma candidum TaxID=119954 RepID=A0ACB9RC38_9MYRT|nr:hypothetical protein MLD38_014430 [Melastoma candidum]